VASEIITKVEFDVVDRLMIADPCYVDSNDGERGSDAKKVLGRNGTVLDYCSGHWVAEFETENEGRWGNRVSILRATKKGNEAAHSVTGWQLVHANGVDSGQMFIGCESSFGLDYDALLARYKLPNGEWNNSLNFFAFEEGAVSSTGYGDGCYPVYVRYDVHGFPVAVEVRFMEEEDDPEPYEYDEEEEDDDQE